MTDEELELIEERITPTRDVINLIKEIKDSHLIIKYMEEQLIILKGL